MAIIITGEGAQANMSAYGAQIPRLKLFLTDQDLWWYPGVCTIPGTGCKRGHADSCILDSVSNAHPTDICPVLIPKGAYDLHSTGYHHEESARIATSAQVYSSPSQMDTHHTRCNADAGCGAQHSLLDHRCHSYICTASGPLRPGWSRTLLIGTNCKRGYILQ